MTHNDEFTGRLETYLDEYEGATPLPDSVREDIRAALPTMKQTGALRRPTRILNMSIISGPARYGLVAAVALVAVVIGVSVFGRGGSSGGPVASTSPSATSSASASASATSPEPWSLLDASTTEYLLPTGDYYLDLPAFPARIDFSLPDGWWYWYPIEPRESSDDHAVLVDSLDTGAKNGSAWGFAFTIVDSVRVDPCDASAGSMSPSVTQSPDTLAAAFETWTSFPVTVEDVTLAGYSGKRVKGTLAQPGCHAVLFTTPAGYQFDSAVGELTFLDVQGAVLTIWTTDFPETTQAEVDGGASPDPQAHAADQVQLHAILDSMVITPH